MMDFMDDMMGMLRAHWHRLPDTVRERFLCSHPERVYELDAHWVVDYTKYHHLSEAVNTAIKSSMARLRLHEQPQT